MIRDKGLWVKHTFDNDFVHLFEDLEDKYDKEIFSIQGIANDKMDIVKFSKQFFNKSAGTADVSVDANANVGANKDMNKYNSESDKARRKLNSIYLIYKYVKKNFDKESASTVVERVINGELFVNDLKSISKPYCYAFDLNKLIVDGMDFYDRLDIGPPQRPQSFINLVIQTTSFISNQIVGAVSYPSFFPILNYFYENEYGDDYISTDDYQYKQEIEQQFQNLIYSLNFPFRSSQAPYTNLSVMDKGFLNSLFDGYTIDGSSLTDKNIDNSYELSKWFFEYFNEINGKENMFTFPVVTHAISIDENDEYMDPDFVEWSAKYNSKQCLSNVYIDEPTSFSSCCRLRSDYEKLSNGYQNSFGVGGLSVGSLRVAGLNMARIGVLEEKGYDNRLEEDIELVHKILYSQRQLIEERIEDGFMPLYDYDWIHTNRQYSTIGFVGGYEYVKDKGYDIRERPDILRLALGKINNKIAKWEDEEDNNIYNIEQIPAESMAVRLAKIDDILGYNKEGYELYSNQYLPLIDNSVSIKDRFDVQGYIDDATSGGAILHINIEDNTKLSKDLMYNFMETARETGTKYFGVNYIFNECENGHYTIGDDNYCSECGGEIVEQYTRVVGFITPVSDWNETRRDYEFDEREFY